MNVRRIYSIWCLKRVMILSAGLCYCVIPLSYLPVTSCYRSYTGKGGSLCCELTDEELLDSLIFRLSVYLKIPCFYCTLRDSLCCCSAFYWFIVLSSYCTKKLSAFIVIFEMTSGGTLLYCISKTDSSISFLTAFRVLFLASCFSRTLIISYYALVSFCLSASLLVTYLISASDSAFSETI
jgi:hypothetical protein